MDMGEGGEVRVWGRLGLSRGSAFGKVRCVCVRWSWTRLEVFCPTEFVPCRIRYRAWTEQHTAEPACTTRIYIINETYDRASLLPFPLPRFALLSAFAFGCWNREWRDGDGEA